MIDLGALGGTYAAAFAVNARGRVIGESQTGDGQYHAFSWTLSKGMIDVGIPGASNAAVAVNDRDQIVGYTSVAATGETHAFSWTRAGGPIDLGTLPGDSFSVALALNLDGWVVGYSFIPGETRPHAVLWRTRVQRGDRD
jgi:probable HAF family extracellular repeat protein